MKVICVDCHAVVEWPRSRGVHIEDYECPDCGGDLSPHWGLYVRDFAGPDFRANYAGVVVPLAKKCTHGRVDMVVKDSAELAIGRNEQLILKTIHKEGKDHPTFRDIGVLSELNLAAVTKSLTYLVDRGIVQGAHSPDHGGQKVYLLTTRGQTVVNQMGMDDAPAEVEPVSPKPAPEAVIPVVTPAVEPLPPPPPESPPDGSKDYFGVCPVCKQDFGSVNAMLIHKGIVHKPKASGIAVPLDVGDLLKTGSAVIESATLRFTDEHGNEYRLTVAHRDHVLVIPVSMLDGLTAILEVQSDTVQDYLADKETIDDDPEWRATCEKEYEAAEYLLKQIRDAKSTIGSEKP